MENSWKVIEAVQQRFLLSTYILFGCLMWAVSTDPHCPNPDAPTSSWFVMSGNFEDIISVPCEVPYAYPFCKRDVIVDHGWLLPANLLNHEITINSSIKGWSEESTGMTLKINRSAIPKGVQFSGIYECYAIAPDPLNASIYLRYHLTFGIDVFAEERLLLHGSTAMRYSSRILNGFIALVICLFLLALIRLLTYFSYENRMRRAMQTQVARSAGTVDPEVKPLAVHMERS
uniref:Surface membrane antigen n=1 Tax=Clonorchis sinensis TaxID=79923 RepID=F2VT67_CLOSI|nr:surface membrane antigen [Clonorchis sinensis]